VRYTRSYKPTRIAQCWRLYGAVGSALKVEKFIKVRGRDGKKRLVQEPEGLRQMVSERLGLDLRIFTSNPSDVERTARDLPDEELKSGTDPFADSPPVDL
jgi:hypothetical protein